MGTCAARARTTPSGGDGGGFPLSPEEAAADGYEALPEEGRSAFAKDDPAADGFG